MKKIIFFHLLNDYSGSPKVLSQVIDCVYSAGGEVELFLGGDASEGFLSSVPAKTHRYFYKRFHNKYLTLLSYSYSQLVLFLKLLKYKNESSVFYVNTLLPFGAALAGKLIGVKVVYHIHETSIRPKSLKLFLRGVVAICSSRNIFVSEFLAKAEPFPRIVSNVVYNSTSECFELAAKKHVYHPFRAAKFCVMMACSLKGYKGVYEFVEIARCLSVEEVFTFKLILSASKSEVELFFNGIDLPDNITIILSVNDMKPYYADASILLSLSKTEEWVETFGLTILEGLSFGLPCIVPPLGGPVELVTDNVEGYLIRSNDIQCIVEKLVSLKNDPLTCYRLSEAAKKKSLMFSCNSFKCNLLGVLDVI